MENKTSYRLVITKNRLSLQNMIYDTTIQIYTSDRSDSANMYAKLYLVVGKGVQNLNFCGKNVDKVVIAVN